MFMSVRFQQGEVFVAIPIPPRVATPILIPVRYSANTVTFEVLQRVVVLTFFSPHGKPSIIGSECSL